MTLDQVNQAAKLAKDLRDAEQAKAALANLRLNSGRLVFETTAAGGNTRFETPMDASAVDRALTRIINDIKAALTALGVTF